jgi:hypothetical protein
VALPIVSRLTFGSGRDRRLNLVRLGPEPEPARPSDPRRAGVPDIKIWRHCRLRRVRSHLFAVHDCRSAPSAR